ncbi:MAG: TetR/AcrR family transcriptional regulator [Thermoanaerobaculaceae bacterium]|jgi:AcrR family transcriptional regulator|nr:TetR/AcrR family transcriptional regulator [Thermoanaerobaculaceae bacterium]
MNQAEKSQRSREQILEAALELFSTQGYRATSVRDIAARAEVSTGNVYHHFQDKETIFRTLLDQYWQAIDNPEFPFNQALATGTFPENLEEVGHAARESVRLYRRYVALIYVDVVEFEGSHIRKFYADMARRFADFMAERPDPAVFSSHLRPGISPLSAVMLASRFFLNYFAVEILFGVPNHFGKDTESVIHEIADILRHGMLNPPTE